MKKYVALLGAFLHIGVAFCSGSLDTTFGSAGTVSFVAPGVTGSCMGQGMSLSHDNELIFGGYGSVSGTNGIVLAKYRSDGSLNTAFGNNGMVLTDPSATGPLARVTSGVPCNWSVAGIQVHKPTGKVIVASLITTIQGKNVGLGLGSYNSDGSPDQSFGILATGSRVTRTGFSGIRGMYPYALAVQPDGKIITAGSASAGDAQGNNVFALLRHDAHGMLDKGFGDKGVVKFAPFSPARGIQQRVYGIALQRDGKIVTVGIATVQSIYLMVICRFNSDGSLDKTFGDMVLPPLVATPTRRGYTVATPGGLSLDLAFAVAVQDDQKIVVSGYSNVPVTPTVANQQSSTNLNLAVLRYNQDGSPDTTFGYTGTGMVLTKVGEWGMMPYAVGVQSDGKIVTVGQSTSYDQQGLFDERFATVRFTSNGMIDTTFGPDRTGIVKTPLLNGQATAKGLVLYDNKIAAGGYAVDTARGFFDSAIVQYNQ